MTCPDRHRLTAAPTTRGSSRPSTIVTFSGWTHWSPSADATSAWVPLAALIRRGPGVGRAPGGFSQWPGPP